MLRMYMSEKMQPGLDCCYAAEKFFRTVMDIVVKVEDAERRCVGDENIRVFRNICIMLGLAVRDAGHHRISHRQFPLRNCTGNGHYCQARQWWHRKDSHRGCRK